MSESPKFIGFGCQKSGTTWLWHQIKNHPEVEVPKKRGKIVKELHFFDKLKYTKKEYINKFSKEKCSGEYTPNYFSTPAAPQLISQHFPDAKLILALRNPVDRAFSHYKDHLYKENIPEGISFSEAFWNDYPKTEHPQYSIKNKGLYGDLYEYWIKNNNNPTLFINYEEIYFPKKLIEKLYTFLEINNKFLCKTYNKKITKPYNRKLANLKMNKNEQIEIENFYHPQIQKLEQLLGKKMNWKIH